MNKWLLSCLGLATILVGVLALMPASLVWTWLHDDVKAAVPELEMQTIAGSVWQGSARAGARPFPAVDYQWSLSPWPLLIGRLAASIEGESQGLRFAGSGWVSLLSNASITLPKAEIGAAFINAATRQYGFTLSETVQVESLHARLGWQAPELYWPSDLVGFFTWPGGRIVLETPGGRVEPTLPPMQGEVAMAEGAILLSMTSQGQPALDITLKPDGWAKLEVRGLLMNLLGLPAPPGSEARGEDEVVYIYEERIL